MGPWLDMTAVEYLAFLECSLQQGAPAALAAEEDRPPPAHARLPRDFLQASAPQHLPCPCSHPRTHPVLWAILPRGARHAASAPRVWTTGNKPVLPSSWWEVELEVGGADSCEL